MPFDESPDAYVLPANPADISEGTYRLGVLPKQAGRGPLLIVAIDQADPAANLVNAGAVYFFDVARAKGAGGQGRKPLQFGRTEIFAQIAGDVAGGALGRAFGVIDIDGDNQPEFLVGAPYVPPAMPGPVAGRIAAFSLGSLVAGANLNKPLAARLGAPGDAFGAGFLNWQLPQGAVLVAHASRANTQAGKFTRANLAQRDPGGDAFHVADLAQGVPQTRQA